MNKKDKIPSGLVQAIKQNTLVLFVGAGFSKNINKNLPKDKTLPNWDEFTHEVFEILVDSDKISVESKKKYKIELEKLEATRRKKSEQKKRLSKSNNTKKKVGNILSKVSIEDKHIIQQHIFNKFRVAAGTYCELHELALLLTNMVVTTNYDNAIETAYENLHGGARPTTIIGPLEKDKTLLNHLTKIIKGESPDGFVFKVHGCATVPDSCIIFEEEYEKLYESMPQQKEKLGYYKTRKILETILEDKVVLFIGVSFEDVYMKTLFDSICSDERLYHRHYIITNNEDEKRLKEIKYLNCIKVSDYNNCLVEKMKELVCTKFENVATPDRLRQLKLFRGLSDDAINKFSKYKRTFNKDYSLANCGDKANSFFAILKGSLAAKDDKGCIITRNKDEIIGEFAFVVGKDRIRDIISLENDTNVIEVKKEIIKELTPRDQNVLWQNIVYILCNKEKEMEENGSKLKNSKPNHGPLDWEKVAEFISDKIRINNID